MVLYDKNIILEDSLMESGALKELVKEAVGEVLEERHPCLFSEEERVGIKETIRWMHETQNDRIWITDLKSYLNSINSRVSKIEKWMWAVTGGGMVVGVFVGYAWEFIFKK